MTRFPALTPAAFKDFAITRPEFVDATQLHAIREAFAKADTFRILFVGETIIDEYRYIERLGMTSKEFLVAGVETGREEFIGGVQITAKQGEWPKAEVCSPSACIRKTRYVQTDSNRKLFEVYDRRQLDLHPILRTQFEEELKREFEKADVVIVTDFGHGLFGPTPRSLLEKEGPFLAINAQSNAGNMGFNPVTKWARADFICIDDPEARLAVGMRDESIGVVATELAMRLPYKKLLLTHGKRGAYYFDAEYGLPMEVRCQGHSPARAASGVDTIGTGDAVLAVTAPLVAAGLDMESVALVGNVVGALKVGIVGHRRHVGRKEIMDKLEEVIG